MNRKNTLILRKGEDQCYLEKKNEVFKLGKFKMTVT